ncbi:MAG: Activator of Hsp90 ATPase 1 family protein [Acidimicrobiales bacterium]|jgi:uncharacterized protein YndB with AHSA1/START domain|nr:Activator of Hsp90 ATPase 1 family protein [Acidimicrobiales bacterium]
MSVTDVHKDTETRTMTITAEFAAPVERVWQLWADPRQLERWWGPPTYPATVVDHDLRPGGTVNYLMTGPEGDQPRGYWRVLAVDAPHHLEFEDGFADEAGVPNPDMPTTTIRVALDEQLDGRTRMAIRTAFPSAEAMDQMIAMGMVEGMTEAISQIDDLLGTGAAPA